MMKLSTVGFIAALASTVLACGPARGTRPAHVPAGAVRVVAADQVKGTCVCDDDDDDADAEDADETTPRRPPITYVKLADWEPPPQVQELEAAVPPRNDAPVAYTTFPRLTLHEPIGATSRGRYLRGLTHAR